MFVALSCFEIQNGLEDEVKQAFKQRPKLVENYDGFVRLDVITPCENPSEIWLITYWKDEDDFKNWHKNHLKESHHGIPKGLKLVPHSFKLRFFDYITS